MKQSAAKTLGVAALGAAFAAAAAGTASAAPIAPATPDALGLVTQTLPLGDGLTELPPGAAESLGAGQSGLGMGVDQVGERVQSLPLDSATAPLGGPLGQATGLLGGLPLGGLGL
ncbi:hypothetical protein J7E93_14635 [Streptomyces sp. ISL-36]|uniref:hypothetical protein n=1 Tax=Streptomyces sp. ISL-36 TaxID=2819182 RepID=UPI001BEAB934|nr:hypothetical protein [Streptomyces sp. ISL-36]MBT2441326.1 hypothetical protein [Streptomyces sp. ISL-36]